MLRLATAAMGTRFELVLHAPEGVDARAVGEAALEVIDHWHRRLTRFAPDSLLSHINRTAAASPVRLDRMTFALFEDALGVHHESGGAFDIAVGARMTAAGFGPGLPTDSAATAGAAPSGAATSVDPGTPAFVLDRERRTIRLRDDSVLLDLGAIAKGHAIDAAADVLRSCGMTSALLHGGTSSVAAIGAAPEGGGWAVSLANVPGAPAVRLRDTTLSVSRVLSQTAASADGESGHILDPRTGNAAADTVVAVIGPSARLGDAWATAISVLGRRPASLSNDWTTCICRPPAAPEWAGAAAPGE
jgi:FAD:protein FMN transferase